MIDIKAVTVYVRADLANDDVVALSLTFHGASATEEPDAAGNCLDRLSRIFAEKNAPVRQFSLLTKDQYDELMSAMPYSDPEKFTL